MANNPAAVNVVCQQCGATPAKKVVFQSIAGTVIMHQIRTVKGNFCRDCGLRIKDEMNAYTLKRGWFSIGGIIGIPMFLGINAIRAGRLNKLPAPVRPQPQGWQGQPQGQAQAWPGQPQPWQGQAQAQPQAWQGQPQGLGHDLGTVGSSSLAVVPKAAESGGGMRRHSDARLATVMLVAYWGLAGAGLMLRAVHHPTMDIASDLTGRIAWGAYPTVGAVLVARLPGNRIGWLCCGIGLLLGPAYFGQDYGWYALVHQYGILSGGLATAWHGQWPMGTRPRTAGVCVAAVPQRAAALAPLAAACPGDCGRPVPVLALSRVRAATL